MNVPYCDNWFQQGITRPQKLALSLINMEFGKKSLRRKVRESTLSVVLKDTAVTSNGRNNPMHKYNYGANKADIAKGWIYIGALVRDSAMLGIGVREVFAPISFTTGEGIQHDLSYDMHYGYLYNGAYGIDFSRSVVQCAKYLYNTPYALQGVQLHLFRKFLLESIFGVMRGKWIDWNVLGRGISRKDATRKDLSGLLKVLRRIDPEAAEKYDALRRRMEGIEPVSSNVRPSHRVYWITDFTVHSRPEYYLSIHAVSNRNYAQEIGNKENLQGFWGAQGTVNLLMSGQEYDNIFPVWNWARLPGTTLPDTVPILKDKAPGEGDRRGTSAFSGGVSDSLYGASAYVVTDDLGVSSKKSWFMFDDEIVCLGSGIRSVSPHPVNTTLNQCIYDDAGVYLGLQGEIIHLQKPIDRSYEEVNWLIHDSVAYVFPHGGQTNLQIQERSSDWSTIRGGDRSYNRIEHKTVFQLALKHGVSPQSASYAYMLIPGINMPQVLEQHLADNPVKIIENNQQIQAVYHQALKIRQIVFYDRNLTYADKQMQVTTDVPAIIMIREISKGTYRMHVADPAQRYPQIMVKVNGPGDIPARTYRVDMPQGPYSGQTVAVDL